MRIFTSLSTIVLLCLCAFQVDAQISSLYGGGVCDSNNILYTVGSSSSGGYSSGNTSNTNVSYRWSIGSPFDAGTFIGKTTESGARVSWDLSKIRNNTYITVTVTSAGKESTYNLDINVAGTPPPADPVSVSIDGLANPSATINITYDDAASIGEIIRLRANIDNESISTTNVENGLSYTTRSLGRKTFDIYVENSCGQYGPYTKSIDIQPTCVSGAQNLTGSSFNPVNDVQLGSGSESRVFTFNASNLPHGYEIKEYEWKLYRDNSLVETYPSTTTRERTVDFAGALPGDYYMQLVARLETAYNDACSSVESIPFASETFSVACEPTGVSLSANWGTQAQNEVEITSAAANMTFRFSSPSPEGVRSIDGYEWSLRKPDDTTEPYGTGTTKTIDFRAMPLGRYWVDVKVSATMEQCKFLSPETYSYPVDVNPPCPNPAPTFAVSGRGLEPMEATHTYQINTKNNRITLGVNTGGLTSTELPYLPYMYEWNAVDFPVSGVTVSPAMQGTTTKPGNQSFTLTFTRSGKYEFVARGVNNCSRIPQKVTFYAFFADDLDNNGFGISQVCPPTLPDDLGSLLGEFASVNNFTGLQVVLEESEGQVTQAMLSDFHWKVESSIGVIIKPGVVLTNGAKLTVERGFADDPNGLGGDDVYHNFTQQTQYDDFGNVISENKQYFDTQGRLVQSQTKDLARGVVLASQTVYDRYGRAGVVSLPAPIRATDGGGPISEQCQQYVKKVLPVQFGYQEKLLSDMEGNAYDASDAYENLPVGKAPGSIGWYYSANNQAGLVVGTEQEDLAEDQVATTAYPLVKTLYRGDGSGEVVGQTLPGDHWYEEYDQSVPDKNNNPVSRTRTRVVHTARSQVETLTASDEPILQTYLSARAQEAHTGLASAFSADSYYKQVSEDANGRRSVSYYNREGQSILNIYYGEGTAIITQSSSFYDDRGRMVASLDPKGLKTSYQYDFRGRLLSMSEPDAGKTEYVYRKDGSIRFSQNAKQREENQYSYTHYDAAGRATESGEWTPTDAATSIISLRADKDLLEQRSQDLPAGATVDMVKTGYDGQGHAVAPSKGQGSFLMGKVSYSEKPGISKSWYSYDERGRVTWMVQDIAGLGVKTVDYTYNSQGNVRVVAYQAEDEQEDFYHYYEYDADTRLQAVYTSTTAPVYAANDYTISNLEETYQLQASYSYYLHGPLKQVTLADGLQQLDYYYTVQGWLKAINNPNDTDAGNSDVFAMQLDYFAGDYSKAGSGINNLPVAEVDYSGNIQTQSWINNGQLGAYQYGYDAQYQLRQAIWKTPNFATATLGEGNSLYDVQVSYTNPATNKLDGNGNIHQLVRHEPTVDTQGNINGFQAKPYEYFYQNTEQPNTLTRVADYADYTYNAIGQMQTANYEEVPEQPSRDMKLVYDVSGKVTEVRSLVSNEVQAQYTYDDRGYRIKTEADGKETYYIRDASGSIMSVYVKEVSGSIQVKEYPIYGSGRVGVAHRTGENYAYLYELKDHLGNVRATVQDIADPVDMYADYYPFGLKMNKRMGKGTFGSRYGFQGEFAEEDEETGFNHFELRSWDPIIGRWMAPDPMRQYASPYLGMGNSPINRIDSDGGLDNPIYSSDGTFRGVDEFGLQGEAIIYDGAFKNGMNQSEILGNGGTFFSNLSSLDRFYFMESGYGHWKSLRYRPDWDGVITFEEAINWYHTGDGKPLYVDISKMNFKSSALSIEQHFQGTNFSQANFFVGDTHPLEAIPWVGGDFTMAFVYGTLRVELLNRHTGLVGLRTSPDYGGGFDGFDFNISLYQGVAEGMKSGGNPTPFNFMGYGKGYIHTKTPIAR